MKSDYFTQETHTVSDAEIDMTDLMSKPILRYQFYETKFLQRLDMEEN